uniref:Uncharacterized protein n=1 Tax=Acrobeloides nanus TaxID=290746 RepID=A0A914DMW7_9BILA
MTTICFDTCFNRLGKSSMIFFNVSTLISSHALIKARFNDSTVVRFKSGELGGHSPMGIDFDEVRAVFAEELLGVNGFVPRGPVLLKAPPTVPEMLFCSRKTVLFQHVH